MRMRQDIGEPNRIYVLILGKEDAALVWYLKAEKSEKKLRKAINDEKALQHQLKQLPRKERTHRLYTRGDVLESFLQEPEHLTDDDVMLLFKLIFHKQDTQELLKNCWNGRSQKSLSLPRTHYPKLR